MAKITPGYILPSAAFTISKKQIAAYERAVEPPQVGDLVYGEVVRVGQHSTLENKSGRIHAIYDGSKAVFVYGNRYAPDYYESVVPSAPTRDVDLVARSGVVGQVQVKNSWVKDPTRVRVLGQVLDASGQPINTRNHALIRPSQGYSPGKKRAKLVLVVGSSMNAGKSAAAAACCWALSTMGHEVRASKLTGTASLKDILHMNDAGASIYNDFTHLGYPSTYLLEREELLDIFRAVDARFANNPRNYWVVELADGVLQRETAMLLASDEVRSRIHRLIFCGADALGCIAGLQVLRDRDRLVPDAISGLVSSSPLGVSELASFTDIPVFDSIERDLNQLADVLV